MSASIVGQGPGTRRTTGRHAVPSAERVYAALREEVLAGLLPEGARLVETEIASRFGVSRTPVREALARLQVDRLTIGTAQGPIVRPVSLREIQETYVLREAFEGLAARLAAARATTWDVTRLNGFIDHMESYRRQEQWQAWAEANWHFHDAIFQASGNARLRLENGALVDLVRRFFRISAANDAMAERTLLEHRQIVGAIEARDGDAAENVAQRHVMATGVETIRQIEAERQAETSADARPSPHSETP